MRLNTMQLALARRLQHATSLASALEYVGFAQIARGDTAAATATASELLALSGEYGLPHMRGIALTCLGWTMGQTKDIGEGLRYLEQGLATRIQLGARPLLPFSICLLAETYLKAQRYAEGIEQVNLALKSSEIGEQWFLPRIHMASAQLLQQQACPNLDAAEASLRTAIDVAQAQCAKVWELRATTPRAACGATRASAPQPATCSRRSTAGSPRVSTRRTLRRPRGAARRAGLTE